MSNEYCKTVCLIVHVTGGFGRCARDRMTRPASGRKAIRDEVLERRIPPWSAAPGFGDFSTIAVTRFEVSC